LTGRGLSSGSAYLLAAQQTTRAGLKLGPRVTLNLTLKLAATNGLYLRPTLKLRTTPNVGRQTGVQDAVDFGLNLATGPGFRLAA
jgi:hypothetical protein